MTASTIVAKKSNDVELQLPTTVGVQLHTDETAAARKTTIIAIASGFSALLLIGLAIAGAIILTGNNQHAGSPTASELSVNISLNLFKHPELLELENTAGNLSSAEQADPDAKPEAVFAFGMNICNFWNWWNPIAVDHITNHAHGYQHVLNYCSKCERLDYSVPNGLLYAHLGWQPGYRERYKGWGNYVCGKYDKDKNVEGYGIYRGGAHCQNNCCSKQDDYCKYNCFGGKGCYTKCMNERGCLDSAWQGAEPDEWAQH